jgi:NAD(P)-dependent dehydrogenase (short-subunit alcohol dehydrogenase family)
MSATHEAAPTTPGDAITPTFEGAPYYAGKVVLITGPTNGLGSSIVDAMCVWSPDSKPSKVILVARNVGLCEQKAALLNASGIETAMYICDLAEPGAFLPVARMIAAEEPACHVACLNAGCWLQPGNKDVRVCQSDNLEVHYCTNFLHMVFFVEELSPLLESSGGGRICVQGSFTGMSVVEGKLDLDLSSPEGHAKTGQKGTDTKKDPAGLDNSWCYPQSKLAQHVWCKAQAPLMPSSITLNVCCPGAAAETNVEAWAKFRKAVGCCWGCCVSKCVGSRSTAQGAGPMLHLMGIRAPSGAGASTHVHWQVPSPGGVSVPACTLI